MSEEDYMPTRQNMDRIGRLNKRLVHLRERISKAEIDGEDLSFDKAEASALVWAIDVIESLMYKSKL
jgi:hypothetical protein